MSQDPNQAAAENNPERNGWLETLKSWLPLLTPVLTAAFGFIIWNAQAKIQWGVDHNNRLLEQQHQMQLAQFQAQLSLKEEFYRRRLAVYDKACQQIADTQTVLADVGVRPEDTRRAIDLVSALNTLRNGNKLYWSQPLDQHLEGLWGLVIRKLRSPQAGGDDSLNEEIEKEVAALHAQMKTDLDVKELTRALQEAAKPSPDADKTPTEAK